MPRWVRVYAFTQIVFWISVIVVVSFHIYLEIVQSRGAESVIQGIVATAYGVLGLVGSIFFAAPDLRRHAIPCMVGHLALSLLPLAGLILFLLPQAMGVFVIIDYRNPVILGLLAFLAVVMWMDIVSLWLIKKYSS